MRAGRKTMGALSALLAVVALAPAAAHAQAGPKVPVLNWQTCDTDVPDVPADVHFQCATATVPLDYSHPNRGTYQLALMRKQATNPGKRLGSLFINYGGPGGTDAYHRPPLRTQMARRPSISVQPSRPMQGREIGFRRRPAKAGSRLCACTARRSRFSTRAGT